jgi:succinylglutamate desuccinylase
MKDNTVKYIALAILVAGGIFLYTRVTANKQTDDVDVIINAGMHGNKMFLETLQPEFIKAWADAVRAGATTFQYNAKTINTKGGSTVK